MYRLLLIIKHKGPAVSGQPWSWKHVSQVAPRVSGSMTQPPLFEALQQAFHQAAMLTWPQIGVGP